MSQLPVSMMKVAASCFNLHCPPSQSFHGFSHTLPASLTSWRELYALWFYDEGVSLGIGPGVWTKVGEWNRHRKLMSAVSSSGCYRCYIISLGRPSCPVVSSRGVSVLGVLVGSVGNAMRV